MACEFPRLAVFERYYSLKDKREKRKLVYMHDYSDSNIDQFYGRMRDAVGIKDQYDRNWYTYQVQDRFGSKTYDLCLLPCGQCISCRLEYSRQWAIRCMLEASQHEFNYFLTLTYAEEGFRPDLSKRKLVDGELPLLLDDETRLPVPMVPCKCVDNWLEDVTGELHDNVLVHPLQPEDLQLFIKRLRKFYFDQWKKSFPDEYHKYSEMKSFGESDLDYIRSVCKHMPDIRFYAVGEYGPQTLRPHYHLILFNCFIPDLEFLKISSSGAPMYTSKILTDLWPYGFHTLEECTYKACAYVARYMLKKHKGLDANWYENHGLVPEFSRCSRRPGIARKFLDENMQLIYDRDSVIVNMGDKVMEVHPPQYYDRIFADHHPFEMEQIKDNRRYQNALQESIRFFESGEKRSLYDSKRASQRNAQARALPRGN